MSGSLPRLRRSVTPARTSRPMKRSDFVQLSAKRGENVSEEKSFLSAVGLGMRESVQELVRRRRCDFLAKDPRGRNCVHLAVKQDDVSLLELLCEQCKVPPGLPIRDEVHATAVHRAAKSGSLNCLKYLIERAKVNPHSKDTLGRNALFYAVEKNRLEVAVYLVKSAKLATKSVEKDSGNTVLHIAAERGFAQLAMWLVEKAGLDPHLFNNMSRSALHLAVKSGSLELVRFLHSRKDVNPFLPDNKNMSSLGYSAQSVTCFPIFQYFLSALGVSAILLGDPGLSRSLWNRPATAAEIAEQSHNTAALALISRARKTHARVAVLWVNSRRLRLPAAVIRAVIACIR